MAPFVEMEWGKDTYGLMREIKRLLDPANILNPGVVQNTDPDLHVKNLKHLPVAEPKIDRRIECGFCKPICPSHNLSLSPRQCIISLRAKQATRPGLNLTAQSPIWWMSVARAFSSVHPDAASCALQQCPSPCFCAANEATPKYQSNIPSPFGP